MFITAVCELFLIFIIKLSRWVKLGVYDSFTDHPCVICISIKI